MVRSMLTGIAAGALVAAFALASHSAWAFSTETLNAGQNGNSRFADPDDQVKNFGQQPFGANGPMFQFGGGSVYARPGFGPAATQSQQRPPNYYAMPPGNGD
jgi:hypothetical protein